MFSHYGEDNVNHEEWAKGTMRLRAGAEGETGHSLLVRGKCCGR